MKEVRGTISKEELEAFGGVEIALLDAGNDSTGSSTVIEGSMDFRYTFTYNDDGFQGLGWRITQWVDYTNVPEEDRDQQILANKDTIGFVATAQGHPCARRLYD